MLKTEKLSFSYGANARLQFPDIALGSGENLLILGESGVGKTTLLHLIGGLLTPNEGCIVVNNTPLEKLSHRKLDAYRGKHIGIVFQKSRFIQSLTVIDNLKLKLFFSKETASNQQLDELLGQLGLLEKKNEMVLRLSEGQKQRLSIAVAVCNKPQLILADEPTASLDNTNAEKVINLLKEVAQKEQANLLVITHDERIKHQFTNILEL